MKFLLKAWIVLFGALHVHKGSGQILSDTSLLNPSVDTAHELNAITVEAYQISSGIRTIPGGIAALRIQDNLVSDETNLSVLLNSMPGLYTQSGTYTTNRIVIRGMGSRTPYNTNRLKVYLNDIPITGSDGLSSPEEIDMQSIERIEVIKGPSSALFGSGLGGSLNLYTHGSREKEQSIKLQIGSFGTVKTGITAAFPFKKTTFRTTVNRLQSEGYRENSEYRRTSFLSELNTESLKWKTGLLVMLTGVNSGLPSSLGKSMFINNPGAAAPNWKAVKGYKQYTRGIAGLTIGNTITSLITNKLLLFGRFTDSFEKRPFNNLDDFSSSVGIRNKVNVQLSEADLILGFELIHEWYSWKLDTNLYLINHNREKRNLLNVFSILYYRPSPVFNITFAGAVNHIRYSLVDLYEANGNQSGKKQFPVIFSPRFGVNYSPNRNFAFFVSAGHGFSLPSPEEALLPEGEVNTGLRHENGWQFEIGSRLGILNQVIQMDAVFYWIHLKDLLVTKRLSEDIFTGINAGMSRHAGAEIIMKAAILRSAVFPGQINSTIAYTQTLNRFIKFEDEGIVYDNRRLPGIPDNTIVLQLEWSPFRRIEVFSDVKYTGSQYLNDSNTGRYEAFWLANLKVMADLVVRGGKVVLNMYAGMNNIGNISYASMIIVNARGLNGSEPRYYYPGMPRNIYMGLKFSI